MPEAVPESNDYFHDFRHALSAAISAGLVCSKIAMAWALGQGLLPSKRVTRIAAAAAGNVGILEHLCSEDGDLKEEYIAQAAAYFGQLGVLRFYQLELS